MLSPTALVPFCSISGNFSVLGLRMTNFSVPVCRIFKANIKKDQLCYTVDLNDYKGNVDSNSKVSLELYIDYNEDRQLGKLEEIEEHEEHSIVIETISIIKYLALQLFSQAWKRMT